MKRKIVSFLIIILLGSIPIKAAAALPSITIKRQPQSSSFPENASASWSVEAEGKNLSYNWFIVYKGVAYNTEKSFAENHPWQEGVTGDGYGTDKQGNVFSVNGIGSALDGAKIYCVISDGIYSITSSEAHITVGAAAPPPSLTVPASVTIEKDKILKLLCDASVVSNDSISSYLWYETSTGRLEDITAIGSRENYEESNSVLVCDTAQVGTRYYVCAVKTKNGGFSYSSVIPVTVTNIPPATESQSGTSGITGSSTPEDNSTQGVGQSRQNDEDENKGNENRPKNPSSAALVLSLLGGLTAFAAATTILLIKKSNRKKQTNKK